MMPTDSIPSPEEKETAPEVNVSGIPADHFVIDMSAPAKPAQSEDVSPEQTKETTEAPIPVPPFPEAEVTVPTVEIVGIRFKKNGKIYYFDPRGVKGMKGEYAIVETARGQEYGEIALENTRVPESEIVPPIRPMLRIATKEDRAHFEENKKKEEEAFRICLTKIEAHKLDMKLVEAQYTFDNSKLLFYFTSAGRVDFRDLVKDLASVFRTRIELRQIGIRDEAKLIGGLGSCGRSLCCSGFLTDFGQVSIKMAKEQNLSLNSAKISGTCGRLMCCLRYEYETYLEEIRLTPPVDSIVKTPDGIGTVIEIAPVPGTVKVRLNSEPDAVPRSYHRDTVTVIPRDKMLTEAQERAERIERQEAALAEKLSAMSSDTPREIPARRASANAERNARKDREDQPALHSRDEKRHPPKNGGRKPQDGAKPNRDGARRDSEDSAASHNRSHVPPNPQNPNRGKNGNHRGKRSGKTPYRGGNKGGSENA